MISRFYEAVEGDRKVSRQARPLQLKLFSSKNEVSKGRSFHGPDKVGSSNVVKLNIIARTIMMSTATRTKSQRVWRLQTVNLRTNKLLCLKRK